MHAIRRKLYMSQQMFADTYRTPAPTLKNWSRAAAYLLAISRLPAEVQAALSQDAG